MANRRHSPAPGLPLLLAALAGLGCQRPPPVPPVAATRPPPAAPVPPVATPVPHTVAGGVVDGEMGEAHWRLATHSGPFLDKQSGALAIPHSELRLAHDGSRLWLGLYAADENIQTRAVVGDGATWSDDAFSLRIRAIPAVEFALDISAAGTRTDARIDGRGRVETAWQSGADCAVARDGTLNDASDDDEEWLVECAVPLAPLGLKVGDTFSLSAQRCDTPKGAGERCGAWHAAVRLEP